MDLLDLYYYSPVITADDNEEFNRAKRKAFALILPKIMENELTERQRVCIKMKYIAHMTQKEIANKLGISQPSVSRHIISAKKIINGNLQYCCAALTKALYEYEKDCA
ncbi:MAG: sigma-70 family RNA polymerase sigma factor [Eubacterium sp.]|nr:sigma-70 family RNA polymerase sigma factor [Eubacterium sp.]